MTEALFRILFIIYPGMTQQDFTGPHQFLTRPSGTANHTRLGQGDPLRVRNLWRWDKSESRDKQRAEACWVSEAQRIMLQGSAPPQAEQEEDRAEHHRRHPDRRLQHRQDREIPKLGKQPALHTRLEGVQEGGPKLEDRRPQRRRPAEPGAERDARAQQQDPERLQAQSLSFCKLPYSPATNSP